MEYQHLGIKAISAQCNLNSWVQLKHELAGIDGGIPFCVLGKTNNSVLFPLFKKKVVYGGRTFDMILWEVLIAAAVRLI